MPETSVIISRRNAIHFFTPASSSASGVGFSSGAGVSSACRGRVLPSTRMPLSGVGVGMVPCALLRLHAGSRSSDIVEAIRSLRIGGASSSIRHVDLNAESALLAALGNSRSRRPAVQLEMILHDAHVLLEN